MNTINSIPSTLSKALAAALLLSVPVNAVASDDSDDIVVQPSAALNIWKTEVSRDLNQALARSSIARGAPDTSVVQITFAIDPQGRPTDLQFYNDDGNFAARSVAMHAVSKLQDLDSVPIQGGLDEVQFLANIIFAETDHDIRKMARRLEASERQRFASKGKERTYIALGY